MGVAFSNLNWFNLYKVNIDLKFAILVILPFMLPLILNRTQFVEQVGVAKIIGECECFFFYTRAFTRNLETVALIIAELFALRFLIFIQNYYFFFVKYIKINLKGTYTFLFNKGHLYLRYFCRPILTLHLCT